MATLRDRGDSVYIVDNEDGELFSVNDSGNVAVTGTLTVTGAQTLTGATTHTGATALNDTVTIADAKNIVVGTTTGTKIGTAATQKIGFWNVTPVVRPAAFVQTYSTAATTVPNATAVAPATTAASTAAAAAGYGTKTQANAVALGVKTLVDDVLALKKVITKIIDDGQAVGFFQ